MLTLSKCAINQINQYFQAVSHLVDHRDGFESVWDLMIVFAAYIVEKTGVKQLFNVALQPSSSHAGKHAKSLVFLL
ncbi:hypothetical protein IEO70_00280 [Bacillus sp. AGMB 02131]|uniref:Uncharacterized protein n=1 Tax=Peribacillus faecalis TaxID=2772559 RepID=A0A927CU91_9BACI|nr:hypothetical protein [Peribacillus faecalis]MBD3106812.1 hypothetical protein [Peribacillus faecalis]